MKTVLAAVGIFAICFLLGRMATTDHKDDGRISSAPVPIFGPGAAELKSCCTAYLYSDGAGNRNIFINKLGAIMADYPGTEAAKAAAGLAEMLIVLRNERCDSSVRVVIRAIQ